MLRLWSRLRAALRGDRTRASRRVLTPSVAPLESRNLLNFSVKLTATPDVLFPANGQWVPVEIQGVATEFQVITLPGGKFRLDFEDLPGAKQAELEVIDEYRQYQLDGPIKLTDEGGGTFTFEETIYLQAKRAKEFAAGRRYYITVGAHDSTGWAGTTIAVQVPPGGPATAKPFVPVTPKAKKQ